MRGKKNLLIMALMALQLTQCHGDKSATAPVNQQNNTVQQAVGSQPAADSEATADAEDALAAASMSPMEAIKDLDKKLDKYKTGPNLTEEEILKNKKLKLSVLKGTFDIRELCKLALAQHWETLSESDRNFFVDLMINLLEKKAIFSKEQVKTEGKPYQVNYKSQKILDDKNSDSLVMTSIHVPSQKATLNINYKLKRVASGWKIYDVIVDEASLVENYKFQFDTIINKYGYPELITRMQNKLKQME